MSATDRAIRRPACPSLIIGLADGKHRNIPAYDRLKRLSYLLDQYARKRIMNTAIIGLGNIGLRLAANLAKGGEHIIVSERNLEKATQRAAKLGTNAEILPIDEAIEKADVIVIA